MTTNPTFAERLTALGKDLERWRTEAERLRALTDEALATRQVDQEMLVNVEQSATLLYKEIDSFKELVGEVASQSPAAAAELATVDDTLRLLLLEVTELSTRLYSIRSMDTQALPEVLPK